MCVVLKNSNNRIWKCKVTTRLRARFKHLPLFIQKEAWKAMDKMCNSEDPTKVYDYQECLIEVKVQYVAKLPNGLNLAYRILRQTEQLEFITIYQNKR